MMLLYSLLTIPGIGLQLFQDPMEPSNEEECGGQRGDAVPGLAGNRHHTAGASPRRKAAKRKDSPAETAEPPPDWFCLRTADVARRLGIHPKTVQRNYKRYGGKRSGGRLRFSVNGIRGSLK